MNLYIFIILYIKYNIYIKYILYIISISELNDSEVSIKTRISNKIKGKKRGGTLSNKYSSVP